jgi:hypothetical protein
MPCCTCINYVFSYNLHDGSCLISRIVVAKRDPGGNLFSAGDVKALPADFRQEKHMHDFRVSLGGNLGVSPARGSSCQRGAELGHKA